MFTVQRFYKFNYFIFHYKLTPFNSDVYIIAVLCLIHAFFYFLCKQDSCCSKEQQEKYT